MRKHVKTFKSVEDMITHHQLNADSYSRLKHQQNSCFGFELKTSFSEEVVFNQTHF